jgi:hypothetical protein
MNGNTARFVPIAVGLVGLVTVGCVLTGQAAKPAAGNPLVTDWSHRHVIFSQPATAGQASRVAQDPRYLQQQDRRSQSLMLPARAPEAPHSFEFSNLREAKVAPSRRMRRDWSEDLGTGASIGAGNYPAKFSFRITTANCASDPQPDFVVFSTGLVGSSTQASIVAYDNLYSGCTGTVPSVFWAYNTSGGSAGQILTSPAFSRHGEQIAFVQTNGTGAASLVLLKWAAGTGTVGTPVPPTAAANGTAYSTCIAPCMLILPLLDRSSAATDDTTSSVFIDYSADIAWVGDKSGLLHQFTGVFQGIPAEVLTAAWPAPVTAGVSLSSPVHDFSSGNVFVGDAGGFLHRVDSTTAAVTTSGQLDFGTGIVEGPVVDSTNSLVYVFASSDNSGTCAGATNCAAVYQLGTAFAATTAGTKVTVGTSGTGTPNPMFIGGFDNAYLTSTAPPTGNLYVCGNTGAKPTLYQISIQAGVLPLTGNAVAALTPAAITACSPVTDVLNPNDATGGPEERIFVSVKDKGVSASCSGGGCLLNFVNTPWKPLTAFSVGQQILDNNRRIEVVTTAGTSGALAPVWPTSSGVPRTDGTVSWVSQGLLSFLVNPLPAWPTSAPVNKGHHILDTNGNVEVVILTGLTGTTGATQPTWPTTVGATTLDPAGDVTGVLWENTGPPPTFALASKGGTSGIIIDNTVSSGTLAGTSQVYFSTLSDQTCATSGGTGGCAVQASQPALQ